ncbi:hypothetical protein OXX69_000631 [Metschnikowia pulcherrima]
MSSFAIKWLTNRFLKDNQFTKFGVEDPYYEYIVVGHDSQGRPKHKKTKRQIPQGISENDTKVLLAVKQQAFRYDMWFTFFGLIFLFNILVDFLLSLIPIVGDIIEIGYKANSRNFLLLEKHLLRVGKKNMGLITEDEVRPGFLNDKIQPYVEENIVPGAAKAGEQIAKFVKSNFKTSPPDSSVTSSATTQSSDATAIGTLETPVDDDTKSIRSFVDAK